MADHHAREADNRDWHPAGCLYIEDTVRRIDLNTLYLFDRGIDGTCRLDGNIVFHILDDVLAKRTVFQRCQVLPLTVGAELVGKFQPTDVVTIRNGQGDRDILSCLDRLGAGFQGHALADLSDGNGIKAWCWIYRIDRICWFLRFRFDRFFWIRFGRLFRF